MKTPYDAGVTVEELLQKRVAAYLEQTEQLRKEAAFITWLATEVGLPPPKLPHLETG